MSEVSQYDWIPSTWFTPAMKIPPHGTVDEAAAEGRLALSYVEEEHLRAPQDARTREHQQRKRNSHPQPNHRLLKRLPLPLPPDGPIHDRGIFALSRTPSSHALRQCSPSYLKKYVAMIKSYKRENEQ
ncbi:UNVERIFIED_CONTAM: hypothetical protein Sradi_5677000 [Sesamum radiatum]|uniref:Uncharacterized protein n=1 Tax=Sesamum radiatum TaxID=300843 RepID=A0AAW2L1S1_SESRA